MEKHSKTPSLGFPKKRDSNQPPQLQSIAIQLLVASEYIKPSKKRITKALIRLRRYAGWYVPLLFTNAKYRVSRGEAHLTIPFTCKPRYIQFLKINADPK